MMSPRELIPVGVGAVPSMSNVVNVPSGARRKSNTSAEPVVCAIPVISPLEFMLVGMVSNAPGALKEVNIPSGERRKP